MNSFTLFRKVKSEYEKTKNGELTLSFLLQWLAIASHWVPRQPRRCCLQLRRLVDISMRGHSYPIKDILRYENEGHPANNEHAWSHESSLGRMMDWMLPNICVCERERDVSVGDAQQHTSQKRVLCTTVSPAATKLLGQRAPSFS